MTIVNLTDFTENSNVLAQAISVYADAARDDAALVLSTGMVGSDARVTDAGEGFTGVLRWLNYSDGAVAAQPSAGDTLTASLANANMMGISNYSETYVKTTGIVAAQENSIQSLISKVDGLSFLGRQFGAVRARREDTTLRGILQAVAADNYTATTTPAAGTDGARVGTGFGYQTGVATGATGYRPLFENETSANNRSAFFDVLLDAMTRVSGEFEEPFYYLVITPETFNILRKQNVLDVNPVQDGNLNINTLLGGKIRLILSGNADLVAGGTATFTVEDSSNVDLNVSYLVKPGAVHYSNVAVNNPTAIDTNVITNAGFGDVTIVSRWSNIMHPRGYSFGSTTTFPNNAALATAGNWSRVATNVNQTGIFPIFHG